MLTSSLTKSLAFVVLLVSLSAGAMEDVVVAKSDVVVVTPPATEIRKVVCPLPDEVSPLPVTVKVNKPSVKNLWKNTCAYLSSKKAAIKETIVGLKARYKLGGIKMWTNKEKAVIFIGTATAVAATTYAIYKIYKACTKKHPHTVKVRVQHNNPKVN